ncbi:MAG: hypothetical protein K1000chlam2_00816 [Chlamydiae bacterium]|nr:hypothetical protein [Chlamydiota bacterium]
MRLLYTLFTLAIGGYGLFWLTEKNPDLKQKAEEILDFRTTNALEIRFDSSQIMDQNQKRLLKEKGARFLDPELKFFPYLLIEVKYCDPKNRTKESLILWDLTDGEMILNTNSWEKTHGFADCILSHAHSHEFKILHALAERGGSCDAEHLLDKLEMEIPVLESLLRNCLKKNLIVACGNRKFRLHLENPKLSAIPETKLHEQLTTRPHKHALRAAHHFRPSQVEKVAKMAFGDTFSIRSVTEIYLPIHRIIVQKPDGAMQTFHFNALNGKELPSAPFYQ